ncbi:MAG: hypothetical protein AAGD10_13955 [Myxococcota bacterium]
MSYALLISFALGATTAGEGEERRLDHVLASAQSKARAWQYSWIGIYGGLVASQATLAAVADNPEDRQRGIYAAIPASVGITFSLVRPLESLRAVRMGQAIDALYPEDRARRLEAKRGLIRSLARSERAASGWLPRIAGALLNVAAAGAIWAATENLTPAAVQLGVGLASNELKLQTAPRTMRREVKAFAAPVLSFRF